MTLKICKSRKKCFNYTQLYSSIYLLYLIPTLKDKGSVNLIEITLQTYFSKVTRRYLKPIVDQFKSSKMLLLIYKKE